MAKIIQSARRIQTPHYELRFDWEHAPGSGFSFPCDANGQVEKLQPEGQANYERCLSNTHSKPVVALGIRHWIHTYREPAVLLCDCNQKLSLENGMTNECTCGRFYNGSGQSLTHPRLWGEETGERFDDHGHPVL